MDATALALAHRAPPDPALARLHEVTDRIRRRAAEARARAMERSQRRTLSAVHPRELQLTLRLPAPRPAVRTPAPPARAW